MAFCQHCGAKLADDAKFCTECGTRVETAAPVSAPSASDAYTPAAPAEEAEVSASGYTYTFPTPQQNANPYTYSAPAQTNTYSYDPAAGSPGGTQPPRPPRDIPGGSQAPKGKKSAVLPILLIVVGVAALVVLLIGIFGGSSGSGDVYNAAYVNYRGVRQDASDTWEDGFSIELFENGKCRAQVNDAAETCRYELDDNGSISIHLRDDTLTGTLSGDVLELENVFDTGWDVVFVREGASLPDDLPTATATAETGEYDWWNGDWYGWWIAYDGGGTCKELVGYAYDTCATIYVDGDVGLVDLWDVDCVENENISYVDVAFQSGTTDKGRMVSESGYFYNADIGSGDWIVDPGDSIVSRFDQMICITGTMTDPDNTGDWFDYVIFLRPWGMSWEDVRADDCSDMPYDDMMPIEYDSWYVPRMYGDMPAYFGEDDAA